MLNPSEIVDRTPDNEVHAFLIQVGVLLQRFGTPSHRLEGVLVQLGNALGVQAAFLYTPTALISSITDSDGEATYVRRVESGPVDVDKLIRFDEALERLEAGELDVAQASAELQVIADSPSPYPRWAFLAACGISSLSVAVLFGGGGAEALAAGILGTAVCSIEFLIAKNNRGVMEPIAGLFAAVAAVLFSRWILPIDDRMVTLASFPWRNRTS